MKVYDVNVNELEKPLVVQCSSELQTVRFGFESETSTGEYAGVIMTMNKQTALELAHSLIKAVSQI